MAAASTKLTSGKGRAISKGWKSMLSMKRLKIFFLTVCLGCFFGTAESSRLLDFVTAARSQIGKTVRYDPSYRQMDYPNGDIPIEKGVCTDVIIRALRDAYGYDLQKYVHEDMEKNFSDYPQIWGLTGPDKNIDHRRVPNLQTFFKRNGWSLPAPGRWSAFEPGDIVTCIVPPNLPHIMLVSDTPGDDDVPFVIHNIGNGTREEDRLFEFELTGHYRVSFQ
jgi:uncharacterized protein YijF (DUF1287 family)